MSGHRITAIIAFALCTSGAFAANESAANKPFDCDADWPCDYFTKPKATFYSHKIENYDSPRNMWPHNERTRYGQTILHFASNEFADPEGGYQMKCSNGKLWDDHTVTSGAMVYVTGESQSYTMPDGWHYVSREEGKKKGWGSDGVHDWVVSDNEATRVPLFGDKEDYLVRHWEHEFEDWENDDIRWGAIWKCEHEQWWHYKKDPKFVDELEPCDDYAHALKDQNNKGSDWAAVKTLVPGNATDFDVAYHTVIASPGTRQPCLTYRCRSDYKATCNFHGEDGECNGENMSCVRVNTSCPMPKNQNMVEGQADVADCSADYGYNNAGSLYISDLKRQMNKSLTDNNVAAKRLYEIEAADLPFTCDNGGCALKDDVFNGRQCEFRCFEEGIRVRLAPKKNGGRYTIKCLAYFKPEFNDNNTYTCVFDVEAAQKTLNKAATDAKEKCATAICRASNGTYKNNKCMCGNDECTSTTSVNGTPYTYCGGTDGSKDTGYFCGQDKKSGEWQLARGLPNNLKCDNKKNEKCIDYKNNGIECVKCIIKNSADVKTSCPTSDDSADGAANNAADTISALAKTLDEIEDAYGLSKWRTVDGKFNYARLASDATAAVVLGTTGALVTSSVVKKKQVEAGFESLECTVGGQHVGDWGDVFRIDGK